MEVDFWIEKFSLKKNSVNRRKVSVEIKLLESFPRLRRQKIRFSKVSVLKLP